MTLEEQPSENLEDTLEKLELPDLVFVGSGSALKIKAITDTLARHFPGRKFIIVPFKNAQSNTDEQPVGPKTIEGAKNRIDSVVALADVEHPEYKGKLYAVIAMENGIWDEQLPSAAHGMSAASGQNRYVDRVVVAIKFPDRDEPVVARSEEKGVVFPNEYVDAAKNAEGGFKKWTVGKFIKSMGEAKEEGAGNKIKIDNADPHSYLTGGTITRIAQIEEAIEAALEKAGVL